MWQVHGKYICVLEQRRSIDRACRKALQTKCHILLFIYHRHDGYIVLCIAIPFLCPSLRLGLSLLLVLFPAPPFAICQTTRGINKLLHIFVFVFMSGLICLWPLRLDFGRLILLLASSFGQRVANANMQNLQKKNDRPLLKRLRKRLQSGTNNSSSIVVFPMQTHSIILSSSIIFLCFSSFMIFILIWYAVVVRFREWELLDAIDGCAVHLRIDRNLSCQPGHTSEPMSDECVGARVGARRVVNRPTAWKL